MSSESNQIQKHKTRDLSILEFFETVQIEYICASLRARIYPRAKDKKYWTKVQEGKRQTIESIALRNFLPSIFTDSDLEASILKQVYRENTYPIFVYKDEEQRSMQEYFDLLYYYHRDKDVRFDIGDGITIGKIISYIPYSKAIKILCRETSKEKEVPVECTVRIL